MLRRGYHLKKIEESRYIKQSFRRIWLRIPAIRSQLQSFAKVRLPDDCELLIWAFLGFRDLVTMLFHA
jgi:hypothetical protein